MPGGGWKLKAMEDGEPDVGAGAGEGAAPGGGECSRRRCRGEEALRGGMESDREGGTPEDA